MEDLKGRFKMNEIIIKPIGIIKSPYIKAKDVPVQGIFKSDVEAEAIVYDEYKDGLKDLDGFSHAILVFYFNQSTREDVVAKPYLEDVEHGIFAIRSPHRPNHLGVSVVTIKGIEGNAITFRDVDIINDTPLIDIKPYVAGFDFRENVKQGWLEKHFAKGDFSKKVDID